METCVPITMLALQILTFLVILTILFFNDLKDVKSQFDSQKMKFNFYEDYWRFNWDDLGKAWAFALLGALLANEVGYPLIKKFADFPELADQTLNLTLIAFSSFLLPKVFAKKS